MVEVKYVCKKCKHVEKYTGTEKVTMFFKGAFLVVGLIVLLSFIISIFSPSFTIIVSDFIYSSTENLKSTKYAYLDFAVKQKASELFEGCSSDKRCRVERAYDYFTENFTYTVYTYLTPKEVFELESCDCDTCSIVFCSLLKTSSIPCILKVAENHMYTIVDFGMGWYKIDLVSQEVIKL